MLPTLIMRFHPAFKWTLLFALLFFSSHLPAQAPFLEWATNDSSGTESVYVVSMAETNNGDLIALKQFGGTVDFDPGPGIDTLSSPHVTTAIHKMDAAGNHLWVKALEVSPGSLSSTWIYPNDVEIDELGNLYIAGSFVGIADLDPGPDTLSFSSNNVDGFIAKYDSNGSLIWGRFLTGPSDDRARRIHLDDSNRVFLGSTVRFSTSWVGGPSYAGLGQQDIPHQRDGHCRYDSMGPSRGGYLE